MISPEELISRCHALAQVAESSACDADSLIGFFQQFRPDGRALEGLMDDVSCGDQLYERLELLYQAAGEDRRPGGGRDAYFVIRRPKPITVAAIEQAAEQWLHGIRALARSINDESVADLLDPIPAIRVLEGQAPKHPKLPGEKCELLVAMQESVPKLTAQLHTAVEISRLAETLRPAYYFIACDAMLRDYLMWPLYAPSTDVQDPFAPYFRLWQHGLKYRIFGNRQIDLYVPRQVNQGR